MSKTNQKKEQKLGDAMRSTMVLWQKISAQTAKLLTL